MGKEQVDCYSHLISTQILDYNRLNESKATEVNYDYNNIEGGSTIEYYGYDSRTGNADGSIKKGKAQLKGPAGWVVGSGNGTIVDERSFISSESKASETQDETYESRPTCPLSFEQNGIGPTIVCEGDEIHVKNLLSEYISSVDVQLDGSWKIFWFHNVTRDCCIRSVGKSVPIKKVIHWFNDFLRPDL